MINRTGLIEMVNDQAERMFGHSRAELLGQPVEMLVPGRFRGAHPGHRAGFYADPRSRPMGTGSDLFGLRKDGSEFPVEIGLSPIETGDAMMVLSAVVDISVRKRLEERFRLVVEAAPNALVMVNRAGLIEMANAQAEHMFGLQSNRVAWSAGGSGAVARQPPTAARVILRRCQLATDGRGARSQCSEKRRR